MDSCLRWSDRFPTVNVLISKVRVLPETDQNHLVAMVFLGKIPLFIADTWTSSRCRVQAPLHEGLLPRPGLWHVVLWG